MPVFVVRSKGIVGFLGGRRQVAIGRSAWNGGFGVGRGRCRSSPFGGGGPCEAWWRGTRGVSCPLYVPRLDRKGGVWGQSVSLRVDLGGRSTVKKKMNK